VTVAEEFWQSDKHRLAERLCNYDDSGILKNVIASIPSGTIEPSNNDSPNRAHSLELFRSEPE